MPRKRQRLHHSEAFAALGESNQHPGGILKTKVKFEDAASNLRNHLEFEEPNTNLRNHDLKFEKTATNLRSTKHDDLQMSQYRAGVQLSELLEEASPDGESSPDFRQTRQEKKKAKGSKPENLSYVFESLGQNQEMEEIEGKNTPK